MWSYCEANGIAAKTVTLKLKYSDFAQITRSKTVPTPLPVIADLKEIVNLLLVPIFPPRKGIRCVPACKFGLKLVNANDCRGRGARRSMRF